jgi:LCP family protein required for cell wall assembly
VETSSGRIVRYRRGTPATWPDRGVPATGWAPDTGDRTPDIVVEWPQQPAAGVWPGGRRGGPEWPDEPSPPAWVGRGGGMRRRFRKLAGLAAAMMAVVLVGPIAGYGFLDLRLHRVALLADYPGRPGAGAGQNWLLTGSDSRQGLATRQEKQLSTGRDVTGQRSDTILLLHVPANGGPSTLVSLPRDSYVRIPGYGMNKLNAAYSFGGPQLLAETVQNATGLRIDHYVGIGFGGLVNVVDAVGGVRICVKAALRDRASGLRVGRGCHTLNGAQSLAFVRDRHSFRAGDLQRVQDQRVFMNALLRKATSRAVYLDPVAAIRTVMDSVGSLTVDQGTQLYQLARLGFRLRSPQSTTVPIAHGTATGVGSVLLWDRAKANRLFSALAKDQPVPTGLITGS